MCMTCGCSTNSNVSFTDPQTGMTFGLLESASLITPHHSHSPAAPEPAPARDGAIHRHVPGATIELERDLLAKNQQLADVNREWFAARGILALNLVSSPGSGKTTLLERSIRDLHGRMDISVIEGDQATLNDAERIRGAGARAIQINTGTGCHLEADMLERGLAQLAPAEGSVVMIENVGNLVCPAMFDLGELAKVVILSVTEGEDKPLKYPHMFRASSLMLLNKIDLLPYLRFDVERCVAAAREVNPRIEVLLVSAQTGEGMPAWYDWLERRRSKYPALPAFGDQAAENPATAQAEAGA
ncbi:MAG: hydrogenase nickel incorporation protein HypB [Panacagrimonas sp.]